MKPHELAVLEILNRRRYGRRNFLTAVLGGSEQKRRKEIGSLFEHGYLIKHSPDGGGTIERSYPHYFFRIYEKSAKADVVLRKNGIKPRKQLASQQFWHQVLVDDILLSIEASCRKRGFHYRDEYEILNGLPRELPCEISHTFRGGQIQRLTKALVPDALFSINNLYFVLEADRNSEPIERQNLKDTSYLRKLLQYRQVFKERTYESHWGIPSLFVLNVTSSKSHMNNIVNFMMDNLKGRSRSLLFSAVPTFAASNVAPRPDLSLLSMAWNRVGHDGFVIDQYLN